MGIKIDSHQKIWYVNYQENTVSFIENVAISGDLNNDTFVNVTDVVLLVIILSIIKTTYQADMI